MPVKLWSFLFSPNPLKVRLALAELRVPYETEEVYLFKGEHRAEAFAAVNPHRKVPVLEEDDERIAESNAILVYLGRTRGELWPAKPADEARALRWLFFESAHVTMPCGTLWWSDVVSPKISRPGASAEVAAEAVEELERSLGVIEEQLTGRDYILGPFSLVDCSIGVGVAMLRNTRLDDPNRWPNVAAYRDRLRARPSWTEARGDAIHELR
ncbi:MAG: glutathione S-transferase family protein [Polyangiales bacterium]